MLFVFLFLVLILSITDPTNLRKCYYWISEKHDETFINLTNVFDFICSFLITLGLMKPNGCVPLLHTQKIITKP